MPIDKLKKIIAAALAAGLLALAAGCQRVQDPWVRGPNRLEQERSRSDQAQMALRHRFTSVQTDR